MTRIGLLGVGYLGKIHLKLLKASSDFKLVGFYDPDKKVADSISAEYEVKSFTSIESLMREVDALDIVTPTLSHFDCAKRAIENGKHLFIEKPVTQTLDEARQLVSLLSDRPDLKAQVGHVERYNPAYLSVSDTPLNPMFIEGHRLAMYNPRGTDVPVVLDLMIHDLDIVLSIVKSPVRHISASGVAVISETSDIANARIEFENGCVANLTASRISVKAMRRLRLFQKNTYLAIDFLKKKSEVFRLTDNKEPDESGKIQYPMDAGDKKKFLVFEQPEIPEVNSIGLELEEFAKAIREDGPVRVSISDGLRALDVAHQILEKIDELAGKLELP